MCQRAPTRLAAASSTTSMTREHQRHILAIESIWLVVPFALGAADTQDDPLLVSFLPVLRAEMILDAATVEDLNLWHERYYNKSPRETADVRRFQSITGALLYCATQTRPDIAYSVGMLARAMGKPTPTLCFSKCGTRS